VIDRQGIELHMDTVARILAETYPGFHADLGARHRIWHPEIGLEQGLYYYHRHISTMDRGFSPQWPVWSMIEEPVEVGLDYAIRHEDFPTVMLWPGEEPEVKPDGSQIATVLRPRPDCVQMVGWAEVFWRVLKKLNLPGLTKGWIQQQFRVPMDWYDQIRLSPIEWSRRKATEYIREPEMAA